MFTIILATTAVDIALHAAGVFPRIDQPTDDVLALLASSYRLSSASPALISRRDSRPTGRCGTR